jgi:Calcineurin-like phosphoesterase
MIPRYFLPTAIFLLQMCSAVSNAETLQDSWIGVDRVVAIGDVHGDFERFTAVLRSAGLIDEDGNWTGGKTHLVQVGDALDRGPDGRKVMDLLMKLEQEAPKAGGYVHSLIGDHEAMNVYGDLRYVSPADYESFRTLGSEKLRDAAFQAVAEEMAKPSPGGKVDDAVRKEWESEHPLGYLERRALFGPEGIYGKWIRGHNTVIRIDDSLFVHGGISHKYADYNLKKINERVREELDDPRKVQDGMVTDQDGPLWYRGMATGDEGALGGQVENVLKNFGVTRVVIGHTFTDGAVTPRFGGRVLLIDIGLARLYDDLGRMACLVIEKGKPWALHRGTELELPKDSIVDMLRYLKQAAALDPTPSSLSKRIAALEAKVN